MDTSADQHAQGKYHLPLLVLGALGVVYGDIGTSPLYAMKECFNLEHGVPATPLNVLGVLSLIVWSLILIISVEYTTIILRADNRGEGGILALMVLALSQLKSTGKRRILFTMMGLFGASLLYGDGMITPAITVLGAVEGLEELTPRLHAAILPISIAIIIGLFLSQRQGTARLGVFFGPVILVWFVTIGVLGAYWMLQNLSVLRAINPYYAVHFLTENRFQGFIVLGSVFLVVTGGEALYADMGHFGRRAIRYGWFCVALPALLLNYFGQGAMILAHPEAVNNPFYNLAPRWGLLPLIVLATVTASIASQAVISGAFSLTRQAVLLGYLPRLQIVHTSSREIGQIYIPSINFFLMFCTVGLVLGFRSASNMSAAYGVAVTTTMFFTTVLLYVVAVTLWKWNKLFAAAFTGMFLMFDVSFCTAAMLKVFHGGWFPLFIGIVAFTIFTTWRRGREIVRERLGGVLLPLHIFIDNVREMPGELVRVPGTAVILSGDPHGTPRALLHNIKYNKVLHEKVVVLTVSVEEVSYVDEAERLDVQNLGHGFYRVKARYGFTESPDVPQILEQCKEHGLEVRVPSAAFFVGRETIKSTQKPGMARWRERLFIFLSRNAQGASDFFEIPPNQVLELGVQVEI